MHLLSKDVEHHQAGQQDAMNASLREGLVICGVLFELARPSTERTEISKASMVLELIDDDVEVRRAIRVYADVGRAREVQAPVMAESLKE